MKILIVSDTHRKDENLKWVIRKTKPFDMLIHLGDAEGSEYEIMKWVDKGCDLEMIMGNNDFFSQLEREKELITLNPGSLSYPRQEGHRPSYMLMKIDDNGEARFEQHYL